MEKLKVIYKTMTLKKLKDTNQNQGWSYNGVEWSKPAGKRIAVKLSDHFLQKKCYR